MALTEQEAIIIGCVVGITVLIVFGLILWYFCSKTNTNPDASYSEIDVWPAPKKPNANNGMNEYSQELDSDENGVINPLQTQNVSLLSVAQSTKRILDIDSNALFSDRWTDGNEYVWNEAAATFRAIQMNDTKSKQIDELIQFPTRRSTPPTSDPTPISSQYPAINAPNEVLLPLNDSDWDLFAKMRAKYGNRLKVLYPDDLTRFTQGYCHETDRETVTFDRIDGLLKRGFSSDEYKDEWDFQHILDEHMPDNEEEGCLEAWPVFMYGYDKQGHPVMYDEIGCSNPADLDACFDGKMRKLRTFRFRVMRRLHNTKRIQNMRYGYDGSVNDVGGFNCITKHCVVMNMKNFYAKALTAKYRNLLQNMVSDESNLWPNTLEKMYIVNAPWPFRWAWKVVSKFVHPITVEKIKILDGKYIETMKEYIDLDQIPKVYGGTGELSVKYGYTADIEDDVLDGYYSMSDPIDLETVWCRKNRKNVVEEGEAKND